MTQMTKRWNRMKTVGMIAVTASSLIACSAKTSTEEDVLKVGMVTDAGTIDDKSFNQGTWEGIQRYAEEHEGVEAQYLQPADASTQSFLTAIDNLVLAGNEVIITPGFSFEEAIGQAQEAYPDIQFVLIDGQPLVGADAEGNPQYEIAENTVSISFSEQEASFLTGVASALTSKTGKVGFIGGVEVPAVQKLGWGYVAGVAYANANLGTDVQVIDYIYQGTFNDTQAGQVLASGMFDKEADVILQAAGLVGVGAMSEAKTRTEAGDKVYIVGVDVDQYEDGLMSNGSSIILTSAMKRIDQAAYNMLEKIEAGAFPGGEAILMNASLNGVGLPAENPNLTEEIVEAVQLVFEKIQSGDIQVPNSVESLNAYLTEQGSEFEGLNY